MTNRYTTILVAGILFASLLPLGAANGSDTNPSDAAQAASEVTSPTEATNHAASLLARALELRFDQATAEEVRIIRRYRTQQEEIRIQSAHKFIGGRLHSVVRFLAPEEYRGWRMLTIENVDRSDDHFIFMRSLNRIKRVRAEPADAFFATDFSIEDMERRKPSDYEITGAKESTFEGEPVLVIDAHPTYPTVYTRAEFVVAVGDASQLSARYYKKNSTEPSKEILFPRDSIEIVDGVPVAKHIIVRNRHRRTETHAYVEQILMNPELPASLFSTTALEVDRAIPGL